MKHILSLAIILCSLTASAQLSCSTLITVTPPSGSAYTGGVPSNIYLGYGPQSVNLVAAPVGNGTFTYQWSPSTRLSSTTAKNPAFSPNTAGIYIYTLVVNGSNGCGDSSTVTLYVKDIRVPAVPGAPKGYGKVYVCHNGATLQVPTNQVTAYINPNSSDYLGACQ